MPSPSRDEIFHALGMAAADGEVSVRAILKEVGQRYWNEAEATAFAEDQHASVIDEYGKHMQRAVAAGARAYAAVNPNRPTHVMPIVEEGSFVYTARAREWLIGQEWRDFETLVANALASLPQTEAIFLGRGTQDFGMDFMVRWDPEVEAGDPQGYRATTMFDGTPTFLYGQCKKYGIGHNVGAPDIQRLTGSLAILKGHGGGARAEQLREDLMDWDWMPDAPHYLAFATTARFPLDWTKKDFPNLVKMDGEHVAQGLLGLNRNANWQNSQTALAALRAPLPKVTPADLPAPIA